MPVQAPIMGMPSLFVFWGEEDGGSSELGYMAMCHRGSCSWSSKAS